jgi:hypothetical protein
MTPKDKAEELVKKYSCYFHGIDENLFKEVVIHHDEKGCALIAVDEIIDAITFNMYDEEEYNKVNDYWEQVKHEIEQL